MAFARVCSLNDLWEGDMGVFDVDGTEVLVAHLDGGIVRATQAYCPHQRVALVEGELYKNTLICSQHLWEFDLVTCRGINPDHAEIANYPAEIRGDDVFVDPGGDSPKTARP